MPSVIASTLTTAVMLLFGGTARVRITWLLSAIGVNHPEAERASTSFIPSFQLTAPGFPTCPITVTFFDLYSLMITDICGFVRKFPSMSFFLSASTISCGSRPATFMRPMYG